MRADPPFPRTGCVIDDRLVILDRGASRYLMVAHDPSSPSCIPPAPAGKAEILSWPDERPPRRGNARATWVARATGQHPIDDRPASLAALGRLWRAERIAMRLLKDGLGRGLDWLAAAAPGDPVERQQRVFVTAAHRARRLWSAEDKCLPRSIALARLLRSSGSEATLVLGVAARPFMAHAWVQIDDVVVNDTIDHVTLFQPILVA